MNSKLTEQLLMAASQEGEVYGAIAQYLICVLVFIETAEWKAPMESHAAVITYSVQLVESRVVSFRSDKLPVVRLDGGMSGKPLLGTECIFLCLANTLVHHGPSQRALNHYRRSPGCC